MSIALTLPPAEDDTLAGLLDRLGGISPTRIRMHPAPGTATVKDVVEIEQREKRLFELIDGVLVEKVMGYPQSRLAFLIGLELERFVEKDDLGVVTTADGMIRLPPNLVRMPDVAYASWERFPNEEISDDPAPEIVPDLAVEVLSKSNTISEMSRKIREYFSAGVPLVWVVDPESKSITVYTSPTRAKTISATRTVDGGKVLPGFELSVAALFAKLKRTRKPKRRGQ